MFGRKHASLPILVLAVAIFAPVAQSDEARTTLSRADYTNVIGNPGDEAAFQKFLKGLPRSTIGDDADAHTYYVIEGDLLATEQQVRAYVYRNAAGVRSLPAKEGELLVLTDDDGQKVFWPKGQRNLTYSIDRKTFPDKKSYKLVEDNFAAAANDWVSACPSCGITFQHTQDRDDNPSMTGVTFIIRYSPQETNFIAASFFPNDPSYKHYVFVAPGYLSTSFDKIGVFRHEIGHILGYRHEQNVGVPGCIVEDANWAPLTKYDPHSVMHYFCGGAGTMTLNLTETDVEGHRELYR